MTPKELDALDRRLADNPDSMLVGDDYDAVQKLIIWAHEQIAIAREQAARIAEHENPCKLHGLPRNGVSHCDEVEAMLRQVPGDLCEGEGDSPRDAVERLRIRCEEAERERDEAQARVAELERIHVARGPGHCVRCGHEEQRDEGDLLCVTCSRRLFEEVYGGSAAELTAARAVVEATRLYIADKCDGSILVPVLDAYDAATKPMGSETDE